MGALRRLHRERHIGKWERMWHKQHEMSAELHGDSRSPLWPCADDELPSSCQQVRAGEGPRSLAELGRHGARSRGWKCPLPPTPASRKCS